MGYCIGMKSFADMRALVPHVWFAIISNVFVLSHAQWTAIFEPNVTTIETDSVQRVHLIVNNLSDEIIANINDWNYVRLISDTEGVAFIADQDEINFVAVDGNSAWEAYFHVEGVFLGSSRVFVEIKSGTGTMERSSEMVNITVLRPPRLLDTMFSVTVVVLLAILFINFGAAIDLNVMKGIFKKPVGPAIGTVCQLLFVPLMSYGLGFALFSHAPEFALGLFLTGISPAGGASNIWALLLDGNVNLSIAMTTISTIATFGTIPLWLFALGRTIFERANIGVPYLRVTMVAASLLVPMAIGLAIQKWLPKLGTFLVRILKPLSLVFILIIIVFAFFTNMYMMQMVSWRIAVAGFALPFLGYCFGYIAALIFRQPFADVIAIGIETGVQNTAMTMFLLTFSLEQPATDLTMIIPIAVSVATPIPLILILIIKKLWQYLERRKSSKMNKESESIMANSILTKL